MKPLHAILPALVAAALVSGSVARAEQLVVVEARGVGYAPGATIDSSKVLTLKQGQHLTLISASGNTLKLDGPYNQAPEASAGSGVGLSTKLAALAAGGQRLGEVGTTRGTRAVDLPSPWLLDVSHTGTVCIGQSANPVLYHPAPPAKTGMTITPNDQSWRAVIDWPAGKDELQLTEAVPLHPGMTYYVTMNNERIAISVEQVPPGLASDGMRAAWMAEKGCEPQAEAMQRQAAR